MFTNISWATYLITAGLATLTWYSAIALLHYYTDIKDLLNGKNKLQLNPFYNVDKEVLPTRDTLDNVTPKGSFEQPALQDFEIIEELVERVKGIIGEAVKKQMPKEGFLSLLKKTLKDYPTLRKSQFRPSVNEFISGECEQQGFQGVSMEEVEALWQQ